MDNNQLFGAIQAFITVVETGSFSACSRQLGVSQPTISRQIGWLEEHLAVRLLQRTTRKLSLTEAGAIYYEKVAKVQRDVIEAGLSVSGFREEPSGVLKISAPHTWTELLIAPHLGEFLRQYPEIVLDIECNDAFQDIIADQLDLVVRVGVLNDSSFVAVPFGTIKIILCATPAYLASHGTPKEAEALRQHNFIMFEKYDQFLVTEAGSTRTVHVNGNLRLNSVDMMLSALLQNIGISALPDMLVKRHIEAGELVELMPHAGFAIKDFPIERVYAMYPNRKHLSAKVRAFLEFFKSRVA